MKYELIERALRVSSARLLLLLLVLFGGPAAGAQPVDWTGRWDTRWRDGGAVVYLEQSGTVVRGTYPLYDGRVEAEVRGRLLVGRWIEPTRSGGFVFTLAPDGRSFVGRFDTGEWWTGGRLPTVPSGEADFVVDLASPRGALRTFIVAANRARADQYDFYAPALATIDNRNLGDSPLAGERIGYAALLFRVLDQLTFRVWDVPDHGADGHAEVELTQAGTGNSLLLEFAYSEFGNGGAGWRMVPPAPAALEQVYARLLDARGGKPPAPRDYLALRTPRDTIRTFIEEWGRRQIGSDSAVLSTFNLSQLSATARAEEADLYAQYLREVIDRVSSPILQEIPDDPASRIPYVHFSHPDGNIEIAPYETEHGVVWQFTPQTVESARDLFIDFEDLPAVAGPKLATVVSPYFMIRDWIRSFDRNLLLRAGGLELWQWAGLILFLGCAALVAWLASTISLRLFRLIRRPDDVLGLRYRFVWPLRLFYFALVWFAGIRVLGLPEHVDNPIRVAASSILVAAGAWLLYHTIDQMGLVYRNAAGFSAHRHEIFSSLMVGVFKILTMVAGVLLLAEVLDLPYGSVIAGLGIGGIAVALAARSTLENFIAGFTIYADRPIQVGDFCRFGDKLGTVEQIGLRSTRVRSLDRTLVTVPNSEFANLQIENFAKRDRMLLKTVLQLRYETTPDQLRYALARLRELLLAHPKISDDPARVRFIGLGAYSLDLELFAYVRTSDPNEFLAVQEDLLLRIMDIVDEAGTGFAFPSEVHYVTEDKALSSEQRERAAEEVEHWRRRGLLPFPEFERGHRDAVRDTLDFPPEGSPGGRQRPRRERNDAPEKEESGPRSGSGRAHH